MSDHWYNLRAIALFFWPYVGVCFALGMAAAGWTAVAVLLFTVSMARIFFRELDRM